MPAAADLVRSTQGGGIVGTSTALRPERSDALRPERRRSRRACVLRETRPGVARSLRACVSSLWRTTPSDSPGRGATAVCGQAACANAEGVARRWSVARVPWMAADIGHPFSTLPTSGVQRGNVFRWDAQLCTSQSSRLRGAPAGRDTISPSRRFKPIMRPGCSRTDWSIGSSSLQHPGGGDASRTT